MDKAHFLPIRLRVQALILCSVLSPLGAALGTAAQAAEEKLPDIEIRALELKVEKKSTSGMVLQFTSPQEAPKDRQLLLLKDGNRPLIALRVIKLFDPQGLPQGGSRFAAQQVRSYDDFFKAEIDGSYRGILKIRDISLEELDKQVAEEAGLEVSKPDSPPPSEDKNAQSLTEAEERELKVLAYEETPNYLPETEAIGIHAAFLRLPKFESGAFYVAAAGPRYSRSLSHPIYFSDKRLQDSLAVDTSALICKILDYSDVSGDSYTLVPIIVSGRYNWHYSEDFAVFVYGGLIKPWVVGKSGTEPSVSAAASVLGSIQVALGVGATLRVGPQWYLRTDLGVDQVSLGLDLRF